MHEQVRTIDPEAGFYTTEGCYINELSNSDADPASTGALPDSRGE